MASPRYKYCIAYTKNTLKGLTWNESEWMYFTCHATCEQNAITQFTNIYQDSSRIKYTIKRVGFCG